MSIKQSGRLQGQYLDALRHHFEDATAATLLSARTLGGRAVKRGIETLDLARIHASALATLILPDSSDALRADMTSRGAAFFAEALLPIEETHHIVTEAAARLAEFRATLEQQTAALAESQHEVEREIRLREGNEARMKSDAATYASLLTQARALVAHLREATHALISASEDERKVVSIQLQDEIAQTLLGIHVRLLALKAEVTAGHFRLNSQIEKTRQLVEASLKSVEQFAHTLGIHHAQ